MSDQFLILIPEQAGHVPPSANRESGLECFRKFTSGADEIKTELSDEIRFIDCGENFEKISCPVCEKDIQEDWWQEQMSGDFNSGFHLRPIKLPCCGVERNLHDLSYVWPMGFGRFSMKAMNPKIGKLPDKDLKSIESVMGCPLRVIYQHI